MMNDNKTPYTEIDIDSYYREFHQDTNYQLIDVREVDEYAEGRIPGAVNIPLSEFQQRYQEIETDRPIVLVCARGGRSAQAATFMAAMGYTNLYNLDGGTLGWMQNGHTVEAD